MPNNKYHFYLITLMITGSEILGFRFFPVLQMYIFNHNKLMKLDQIEN